MNTHDVLMYGHRWVHMHVDDLAEDQWLVPGVCGAWSTKEIMAHLTSFEHLLAELLGSCTGEQPAPLLDSFLKVDGDTFNEIEVGKRAAHTPAEVLREYDDAYAQVMTHLPSIDAETLRQPGEIPWYGPEYSLEDLVVYQYYGHKREHCAQIAIFRDTLQQR